MFKKRNVKKSNVEITFTDSAPSQQRSAAMEENLSDDEQVARERSAKERQSQAAAAAAAEFDSENDQDSDEETNTVLKNARRLKKKVKGNNKDENGASGAGETTESTNARVKELIDDEMSDFKYKSNAQLTGNSKELATVYNEIDTDEAIDARAIALKRMELSQQVRDGTISGDVYRGKNYSTIYTTKSDESIRNSKITGSLGPVRAPANVRMTCRFDFDPSLCKDYHDTGYCVFGDSCLYLHDRGDYKNGQEQEREWQQEQKRKQKQILEGIDADEEEEVDDIRNQLEDFEVPKECAICSGKLRNPVKTICDHYFCEACALRRYGKEKTCAICNKLTQGVFSDGTQALLKLRKARNQEKERLRKKATSNKALDILQDSDEDDTFDGDNQSDSERFKNGVAFKSKKPQKKQNNPNKATIDKVEFVQQRVYIDDSGMEVTETVMLDNEPSQQQRDDDSNRSDSEEQSHSQNGQSENDGENSENDEDESVNNRYKGKGNLRNQTEDEDRAAGLAINQLLKKSTRERKVFKASASDWAI